MVCSTVLRGVVVAPITRVTISAPCFVHAHVTVVVNSSLRVVAGNGAALHVEVGADIQSNHGADAKMARPIVRILWNSDEGAGTRITVNLRLCLGVKCHAKDTSGQSTCKQPVESAASHNAMEQGRHVVRDFASRDKNASWNSSAHLPLWAGRSQSIARGWPEQQW